MEKGLLVSGSVPCLCVLFLRHFFWRRKNKSHLSHTHPYPGLEQGFAPEPNDRRELWTEVAEALAMGGVGHSLMHSPSHFSNLKKEGKKLLVKI